MQYLLSKLRAVWRAYMALVTASTPEWTEHYFQKDIPLIDGSMAGGWLMTRVINGERQARQMTEDENRELNSRLAW